MAARETSFNTHEQHVLGELSYRFQQPHHLHLRYLSHIALSSYTRSDCAPRRLPNELLCHSESSGHLVNWTMVSSMANNAAALLESLFSKGDWNWEMNKGVCDVYISLILQKTA